MSEYKNVIYSDANSENSNFNFLIRDIMRVSHSLKLTIVFSSYFTINFQSSLGHGYIIIFTNLSSFLHSIVFIIYIVHNIIQYIYYLAI